MATYTDSERDYYIELLELMSQALKDIYSAGGTVTVRIGDNSFRYSQPQDILREMESIKTKLFFSENGCVRRCQ